MTEPTETPPLATRALQRLHKLAEGNGVRPEDIKLFSAEEKTYDIDGVIILSPLFEATSARYPGGPRGAKLKVMGSSAAMKTEMDRLKQAFNSGASWINEAAAQLKEQEAGGWGLHDVRISLPSQSTALAASTPCPACQGSRAMTCRQCGGQGGTVCVQCRGNRQELCPICFGSGKNPALPNQMCINCNGRCYTPCRMCHGQGQIMCPACHGKRSHTCDTCRGAGQFTEEITITCGARTEFRLTGTGLPSGLRRGLDRLGLANLVKGHADIESVAPPPDEDDEIPLTIPGVPQEAKKPKPPKPELHYVARMPYADMRMDFLGKKVMVGVFGKKEVLLDVPLFLDKALQPVQEKLRQAARGADELDAVLGTRVMQDALKLQLTGTGHVPALRRIYPYGLSPKMAGEILSSMRLALHRQTLRVRGLVAAMGALLGIGIFGGVFLTPLHAKLTDGLPLLGGLAVDMGVLLATLAGCWFALSAATRFALQKRFPGFTIPLKQKTGKTGYMMLGVIVGGFVAVMMMIPQKTEWLHSLLLLAKGT